MVQLYHHFKIAIDGNQCEFYSNPLLDKRNQLNYFFIAETINSFNASHILCSCDNMTISAAHMNR